MLCAQVEVFPFECRHRCTEVSFLCKTAAASKSRRKGGSWVFRSNVRVPRVHVPLARPIASGALTPHYLTKKISPATTVRVGRCRKRLLLDGASV